MESRTKRFLQFKGQLVVPKDPYLRENVLSEDRHSKLSIHPKSTKMYKDLKRQYWRRRMKRDIALFVSKCMICQQVRRSIRYWVAHFSLYPYLSGNGTIWLWISSLVCHEPKGGHDATWVIVDRLTKTERFILIRIDYPVSKLSQLYVEYIVMLHRVLISIVFDRDTRFTSNF